MADFENDVLSQMYNFINSRSRTNDEGFIEALFLKAFPEHSSFKDKSKRPSFEGVKGQLYEVFIQYLLEEFSRDNVFFHKIKIPKEGKVDQISYKFNFRGNVEFKLRNINGEIDGLWIYKNGSEIPIIIDITSSNHDNGLRPRVKINMVRKILPRTRPYFLRIHLANRFYDQGVYDLESNIYSIRLLQIPVLGLVAQRYSSHSLESLTTSN